MAIQFKTYFNSAKSRRYQLARGTNRKALCFVMLNPSRADDESDDPTIGKLKGFMSGLGYSGLIVVNLSSLIEPNLTAFYSRMRQEALSDEERRLNSLHIKYAFKISKTIVAAYGALKHQALCDRAEEIFKWAKKPVYALSLTKSAFPRHPNRLKKPWELIPFRKAS